MVQTTTSKSFEIDEPATVFQLPPQMPEAEGPPAAAEYVAGAKSLWQYTQHDPAVNRDRVLVHVQWCPSFHDIFYTQHSRRVLAG